MRKFLLLLEMVVFACNPGFGQSSTTGFDPANTYIFISGVLKWQSPSLASFSDRNRKDVELYNKFLASGVPKENMVFLKDSEATLNMMTTKLKEILSKTKAGSTFIFYYAGHGVRGGNNGPVCFANYDYIGSKANGFKVTTVSELVKSDFKGKQIWLLADCCYSGSLIEEGKKISSNGSQVAVFTSSSSSNISTGNWTFSQTIIDCFSGLAETDRNKDGIISFGETKEELFDAMKYREKQLSGTYFYNMSESSVFSKVVGQNNASNPGVAYIFIQQNNNFEPARVKNYSGSNVTGELYRYSDKVLVTVPLSKTKPIAFAEYAKGSKVKVEWSGKYYDAEIKETKSGFHFIKYTGYDDSWNEWVMYDRIYANDRKKCKIEWNGGWYPGEMLQIKDGKYFVHYTGYSNNWDEWVPSSRIQL